MILNVPARLRAARGVVLLDRARLCELHQQWWFRQAQDETLVLMLVVPGGAQGLGLFEMREKVKTQFMPVIL